MTQRELNSRDERLRFIVLALGVLVLVLLVTLGTLYVRLISLLDASVELQTCERQGGVGCHIELDNNKYNVYSW